MIGAFLRDSMFYFFAAVLSRGLHFLLLPLFTRVLTPADFGSLDLLLCFAALVNIVVVLEVSQGFARIYRDAGSESARGELASTVIWFTTGAYLIFAVLALILYPFLTEIIFGQRTSLFAFCVGIAYMCVRGILYALQNQLRFKLQSRAFAASSVLVASVTAAFSIFLTYGCSLGLNGVLLGMTLGSLSGCFMGFWFLKRDLGFSFSRRRLKDMLSFSLPLVLSGLAVFLNTYVDRIMIRYYLSVEDVGLYGIGFRLASVAILLMVGIQGALTPLIYEHHGKPKTRADLQRLFRIFFAGALLFWFLLTAFAPELLALMTTEAFLGARQVIIFLVPAVLLSQMYIFAPGLSIAKKSSFVLFINLIAAMINLGLNFFLIPIAGIGGAAFATMAGSAAMFAGYMIMSQRYYRVSHHWLQIGSAGLAGALIIAFVHHAIFDGASRLLFRIGMFFLLIFFLGLFKLINSAEVVQLFDQFRFRYLRFR